MEPRPGVVAALDQFGALVGDLCRVTCVHYRTLTTMGLTQATAEEMAMALHERLLTMTFGPPVVVVAEADE